MRKCKNIKSHANSLLFAETKQKTISCTRIFPYFKTFSESIQIDVSLLYNMYFQTTMTTVSSCYLIKETTLPN